MEKQKNIAGDVIKELQEVEKLNLAVDGEVVTAITAGYTTLLTLVCC